MNRVDVTHIDDCVAAHVAVLAHLEDIAIWGNLLPELRTAGLALGLDCRLAGLKGLPPVRRSIGAARPCDSGLTRAGLPPAPTQGEPRLTRFCPAAGMLSHLFDREGPQSPGVLAADRPEFPLRAVLDTPTLKSRDSPSQGERFPVSTGAPSIRPPALRFPPGRHRRWRRSLSAKELGIRSLPCGLARPSRAYCRRAQRFVGPGRPGTSLRVLKKVTFFASYCLST